MVPRFRSTAVPGFRGARDPQFARAERQNPGTAEPWNPGTSDPSGWTLIELMIVLSIIMILASISLTTYRNSVTVAKEAALHSDLMMMREAIDQYYADKGKYPETLQALVSDSYIRAVPKDPFTQSSDSWQTVEAEPQPGSNTAEPGVYDVKSGADGTALDGTRFSDW